MDLFEPVDKDGKLSGNTVLRYHRLISSILTVAVEWQVILNNPADRARSPRVEKKDPHYLDDIQARDLVEKLSGEPILYRTMILLLIYSGIRRGELYGLKWADIDMDTGVLSVNRALQYLPGRGLFEKEPKSASSNRPIKLPEISIRLLREYLAWQSEQRLLCGDRWIDNDLVFANRDGGPRNPDELTKWFGALSRRTDFQRCLRIACDTPTQA